MDRDEFSSTGKGGHIFPILFGITSNEISRDVRRKIEWSQVVQYSVMQIMKYRVMYGVRLDGRRWCSIQ